MTASKEYLVQKSESLMSDLSNYQIDSRLQKIREARQSLPVYKKASDVLVKIELNPITIVMAATGSGKTTQIPQILFDDYIMQGQGAQCNIVCTQPRRIAAISVAERVAKERGETVGQSVGYQVRFENKTPKPHGSITFCTTGVFLRRLQSALGDEQSSNTFLDSLTHIILDEVHERDLMTDLLLVVLKKLLVERKRMGKKEIKLVLMSATIDPKMFCDYFADPVTRLPAPVVEVSGRSFPVQRFFLEETYQRLDGLRLSEREGGWVWREKKVMDYLDREFSSISAVDDLDLPYPLIALMIADVLARSDDGHVLCFLPGWDEIKAVNMILEDTQQCPLLGLNFNDRGKFEIHILHSTIPVADQQAIFEPPPSGVRRIILSTNIAETSVTIPDVVYVIDSGRVKESRYDPSRHLSSLVSAWVGTSNINQRAGRAGRHRPGEAYAVFSKSRFEQLNVSSTVEMNRVDLSNVVMHIKALDIPGMEVEEVLAAAIEAPSEERVQGAIAKLIMVGALDAAKQLTSLGRVLVQLPIDSPMGKMCLYGAFFRCLDPALTLAAVLTNRDPWMAPLPLKEEAGAKKNSWSLNHFRSDPLVTLRAYTHWDEKTRKGHFREATQFCQENFLGKITLGQIQQVKDDLFRSMDKAGIFDAILGENQKYRPAAMRSRYNMVTEELNKNSGSLPMLAALIAMASVPNFAVRTKERVYRTSQDKSCQIHPSSVQHVKHTKLNEDYLGEKDLFAFSEKIKNVSHAGSSGGPTMLRNVTRLDPLTYMLFGACKLRMSFDGTMQCDDWLPVKGESDALEDVERVKAVLDLSMLRVFEGISGGKESEVGYGETSKRLTKQEAEEFETLTAGVVNILNLYSSGRIASRGSTRPATPLANSGRSTPFGRTGAGLDTVGLL
jgi:HrpA-like RNA helicase